MVTDFIHCHCPRAPAQKLKLLNIQGVNNKEE